MSYKRTSPQPVIEGGSGVSTIAQYNMISGDGTNPIHLIAPHATAGIAVISQGAAAQPIYGTIVVAGGGTGATALTDHGVLVGSGGNPVTVLAVGLTGEALLGTTGADPVFGIITSGIVSLDTTNFNNVLSAADTTVQLALDTIDDFGSGTGAQTVHLYDGAGVKTVTLGSTNTTSTTTIEGGTSINIGTNNAASAAINIGTDSAVAARTITIGKASTNTSVNITSGSGGIRLESSNGGLIDIGSNSLPLTYKFGTGAGNKTVNIGSSTGTSTTTVDCGTGGASFGISANAHTTTIGSINTTSDTIIQSGTNGIDITTTNGPITAISGTGQIDISTDAAATTVNIATGGAAKVATLGSTSGASSLALQYGTADFSMASATGNVMVAQDSGEINYPLQPAFLGRLSSSLGTVTGDGTSYTVVLDTEVFDQGSDYDLTVFTAPVDGKYAFSFSILLQGIGASHTENQQRIYTSNRIYYFMSSNPTANADNGSNGRTGSILADMDAGDVARISVSVSNSTKTVSLKGNDTHCWTSFSGHLVC